MPVRFEDEGENEKEKKRALQMRVQRSNSDRGESTTEIARELNCAPVELRVSTIRMNESVSM